MPVPVSPVLWAGSLIWLAALAVVSFLVTWVATDKLRMWRTSFDEANGPVWPRAMPAGEASGGSL